MKRLAIVAALLFLVTAARGFDVDYHFQDFTQTLQTNRPVFITPLWYVNSAGTNFLTPDRRKFTNDVNGGLTVLNLSSNNLTAYRVEFLGKFQTMIFTNVFPAGLTGVVNSVDYPGYLGGSILYDNAIKNSGKLLYD